MNRILTTLLVSCVVCFSAHAATYKPMRVGPVSAYGALGTNGAKIVSQKGGQQVMLRGMSLFWSDAIGSPYYNENVIAWAAKTLSMDVFRFAMGIQYYDSDGGTSNAIVTGNSYMGNPSGKEAQLDKMVKAAIENDIYIIIDWHSHRAQTEQAKAKDFFGRMAAKYKDVPNIIWEVYNEPMVDMGTIANYANDVIGAIRNNGSNNLAIVGTPNWSQMGSCSGVNSANVAYVLHFYAGTHPLSQFKGNIENCLNGGKAVFISEWGTTSADGNGSVNTGEAGNWTDYMDQKRIPNCNWSLRHQTVDGETENSALFSGNTVLNTQEALTKATYSTSGNFVKSYLTKHKSVWEDTVTAGARSGSCAFKHQTVSELESSVSGVAASSCTYTSSDESVAVIENGEIKIKGAGVAIMEGNDKTKTVVTVTPTPGQTITQSAVTCRINGTGCKNYTGKSKMEVKLNDNVTAQGGTVTYASDNPDVVSVEKANCSSSECYKDKGKQVWIATFKNPGTANIHMTAPAVTGYRALDTTFVFSYLKNAQTLNTKFFKDQTVAAGSTTQVFTVTAHSVPVTYTIWPAEYGEQNGENFVAGNTDATVYIHADAPESDTYEAYSGDIKIVIGAGNEDIYNQGVQQYQISIGAITPVEEPGEAIIASRTLENVGIGAYMQGSKLMLDVKHSGFVTVQVRNMNGRNVVKSFVQYMSAGMNALELGDVSRGAYIVNVKQSSIVKTIPWSNK